MNIFKQLIKSFYSPKDIATYRDVKIGRAILYVFLLIVVATLPIILSAILNFNKGLENVNSTLTTEIPDFTLQGGVLNSTSNQPIIIENKDGFTVIFDSTGEIGVSDVEELDTDTIAFLQKDAVSNIDGMVETFSYALLEADLTKADVMELLESIESFKTTLYVILFLFLYIINVVGAFFKVTLIGLLGLLFKNTFNVSLTYGQGWKISAFAITLPTIAFALIDSFIPIIPFTDGLSWGISILMLFLAIKAIKSETIQN